MPLPLVPIASVALRYGVRYGAVALATYAATRKIQQYELRQSDEDTLDNVAEGVAGARPRDDRHQINGAARWRRVVRLGANGPGIEIDATALGRVKIRKV